MYSNEKDATELRHVSVRVTSLNIIFTRHFWLQHAGEFW